jgi:tetratricopeptide (TPR) repeat protein
MAKYALLIGVSDYSSSFNPLSSAVRDVEALQQVLQDPEIGGFEVKSLLNPDRLQTEDAIEELFTGRRKDDVVLFFFSGHGITTDDGNLYFAVHTTRKDAQDKLKKTSAVESALLKQFMTNSRSRHQVIILDCCFSGAFDLRKDAGSIDIKRHLGGEGRVVLTSSTSDQYSFMRQELDLSVYTHHLVEGLTTGDADLDQDGFIAVEELHEYVKRKVRETEPAMQPGMDSFREGLKIYLCRTPSPDPIQRYKREVQRLAKEGKITFAQRPVENWLRTQLSMDLRDDVLISSLHRKYLDQLCQNWKLGSDIAKIEIEVLQGFRNYYKRLASYEQEFTKALRRENPLQDSTLRELRKFQHQLRIPDENAAYVEQKVRQRMQRFPHLGFQDWQRFLNPKTSIIVLEILGLIVVGIVGFKFTQDTVLKTNPSASVSMPDRKQFPSPNSTNGSSSGGVPPDVSSDSNTQIPAELVQTPAKQLADQANSKFEIKDYQGAIEIYEQAMQLDSQLSDAHIGLGKAYCQLGITKENQASAYQVLSKAIELKPDDGTLHFCLGNAYSVLEGKQNKRLAYSAYSEAITKLSKEINWQSTEKLNQDSEYTWLATACEKRAVARMQCCGDRLGAKSDYEEAQKFYTEIKAWDDASRVEVLLKKLGR